jgi:hypothetical protein
MTDQNTWFDEDDADFKNILYATRDNGDIGADRPGKRDYQEALRLAKLIKKRFKTVKIDIDDVDEWTHLDIRI